MEGVYQYIKSDVFKRTYWYTLDSRVPTGQIGVPVEHVYRIIQMNRKGQKPEKLIDPISQAAIDEKASNVYGNIVGQDSLTRFDKPRGDNRNKNRRPDNRRPSSPGINDRTSQNE